MEGLQGSLEGKFNVFSTGTDGVVDKKNGWKSLDSAVASGWEDLFGLDLDKDSITGLSNNPGLSLGFNGLESSYLLENPDDSLDPITLTNKAGKALSAASSKKWDAVASTFLGEDQGYQVLLQGEEGTKFEGKFALMMTNDSGQQTRITGFKDSAFASDRWFDRFGGLDTADLFPPVESMI